MAGTYVQVGNFRPSMTTLPQAILSNPLLSKKAMQNRAVAKLGIGDLGLRRSQLDALVEHDQRMLGRKEYFSQLKPLQYLGARSKELMGYHFFCPDIRIPSLGMEMGELLNFSMPAWHFNTNGTDMFSGFATVHHPWDKMRDPLAQSIVRLRALIEFSAKMGIPNHCWHDGDYVDLTNPILEVEKQFALVGDTMIALQKKSGIKTGWGTNQGFAIPLYRKGVGSSPYMPAFVRGARQAMQTIDTVIKAGGKRIVFWGGREGVYDIFNTKTDHEKKTLAAFLTMCVKHAEEQGFFANGGKFLIEPKFQEPTSKQYDASLEVAMAFLREFGLEKYFQFNLENNHVGLARLSDEYEFGIAIDQEMLGGVDDNDGDPNVGWDMDKYAALRAGLVVGRAIYRNRGLHGGVINHDAKLQGYTWPEYPMDMAHGVIGAQDACAIGLWYGHFIESDRRVPRMIEDRYSTWNGKIADQIRSGQASLRSLFNLALKMERQGLYEDRNLPSDHREVQERIMGEIQIDLMNKIAAAVRRQGF